MYANIHIYAHEPAHKEVELIEFDQQRPRWGRILIWSHMNLYLHKDIAKFFAREYRDYWTQN